MDRIVQLEIPARPEFVAIARMAVGALAGIRPGLAYERIDDLRIVVSEACTSAIEMIAHQPGGAGRATAEGLRVRCIDGPKSLEVRIEAPGPPLDSPAFGARQQHRELPAEVAVEPGAQPAERLEVGGSDGLALVVPDDGAQFDDAVERDAVVDAPDVVVPVAEAVARFAVGVV